jgi:hypothetical protein
MEGREGRREEWRGGGGLEGGDDGWRGGGVGVELSEGRKG